MKKIIAVSLSICLIVMLLLAGCGQQEAAEETEETMSEGIDTKIEVSYAPASDDIWSMFLSEGDKVAVISPSALPDRGQVDAVLEGLKGWGYEPVEGRHVCDDMRTVQDCLDDLNWALEDQEIKAIFCVRGGYGASEVMDQAALDKISSAGKLIIGYSDITVYHSAWSTSGLPSVHCSMSATFDGLPDECVEVEKKILGGEIPSYTCEGEQGREGEAEGVFIGGNLSTFTSVLGTAFDCTKTEQPYILFLEDEGEDIQHIHRYLAILKHLGVLDRASGIVFGEWADIPTDLVDYNGSSRGGEFQSVSDMISRQYVADLDIPVAYGFPSGHGEVNYPLLMGVKAHLSVSKDGCTLNWE